MTSSPDTRPTIIVSITSKIWFVFWGFVAFGVIALVITLHYQSVGKKSDDSRTKIISEIYKLTLENKAQIDSNTKILKHLTKK